MVIFDCPLLLPKRSFMKRLIYTILLMSLSVRAQHVSVEMYNQQMENDSYGTPLGSPDGSTTLTKEIDDEISLLSPAQKASFKAQVERTQNNIVRPPGGQETTVSPYQNTDFSQKRGSSSRKLYKKLANDTQQTKKKQNEQMRSEFPLERDAAHKDTKELVKKGIEFFNRNRIDKVCHAFTHTNTFVRGDISLFLLDINGSYMASGEGQSSVLWQNIASMSDNSIVKIEDLFELAKTNNGWLHYNWRNGTRVIYVEVVVKEGKKYILGGGYYSFSQADHVVNLVKQAVVDFERKKREGKPVADAFSDMSYPLGRFNNGNLYLFAYDFNGNTMAHGNDPTSIGTNQLDLQDSDGVYIHREMIEKLKHATEGVWLTYKYHRATKRSYIEKVISSEGVPYFIGCGYYPEADQKAVINLVERGYEYLKTVGKTQAAEAFTTKENDDFRYGDIYLFVYDMQGYCIANGKDPVAVGRDYYNAKDDQGNDFVKIFLEHATVTGAWVNLPNKNSIESVYLRIVNMGNQRLVIGAGVYPASKEETMILLVKSAVSFINVNDSSQLFAQASESNGRFIRGNLEVFVLNDNGFCLVYGNQLPTIWQNFMNSKDDDGRPYVKIMINSALSGPSRVKYRLNGATKEAYVQSVKKDGKNYIIGASRYLTAW